MDSKIMKNLKKLAMPFALTVSMAAGQPVMAYAENDSLSDVPTYEIQIEDHKVAVITTKVDTENNSLSGATLQILNSEGEVVDEWVSDGSEHTTMLPEGEYTLHEVNAPEGYIVAEDQTFTVEVHVNEINAGTDHDDSVCKMYPAELFYVESQGQKDEVYCINQGWESPNNTNYNGAILTPDNLKEMTPDSDSTMTSQELYDKLLDIVYHRSKLEEQFPELTHAETILLTEYALQNYASAEVNNGSLFRLYRYDPTVESRYVRDAGNGNALGKLAQHWWSCRPGTRNYATDPHGQLPDSYAQAYYYLVSEEDPHPEDMHLYVYSANEFTAEGDSYQNLLGVRWFDPYDENYVVYLTCVNGINYVPEIPEEPIVPDVPEEPNVPEEPKHEEPVVEQPVVKEPEVKVINDTKLPPMGDNFALEALAAISVAGAGLAAVNVLKKRR